MEKREELDLEQLEEADGGTAFVCQKTDKYVYRHIIKESDNTYCGGIIRYSYLYDCCCTKCGEAHWMMAAFDHKYEKVQ